ncbi:diaminobutyrate acetyltransferase [Vibrio sp. LaRot3]|uniref:diaminobutyrate acetyltransferase n=1 Tax=Vibrio sp. LaRot3 TaxID=2998829 RepID=UPI0022CE3037|nr:diaminobutyrate acetyltransferase [Vibrio sp. LaRot3]MDA0147668.1 diaminobutyrate acetyltransferase [Vibrio sp. LaRot3]
MITSAPWVLYPEIADNPSREWIFRQPNTTDGDDIYQLISQCPPLDVNSSYCNFLQSTHFSRTCVLAEQDGQVAGFVSGYLKPDEPDVLFIWQVAVAEFARGHGLAYQMLHSLLSRDGLQSVSTIETTITKNNKASWALFEKVAKEHRGGKITTFLDKTLHFKDKHDTEYLYRITLK